MTQLLRLALSGPARGLRMIMTPLLAGSVAPKRPAATARASQRATTCNRPSGESPRRRHASAAQLDRLEL